MRTNKETEKDFHNQILFSYWNWAPNAFVSLPDVQVLSSQQKSTGEASKYDTKGLEN